MEPMTRREFIAVSAASVIVTRAGKSLAQASESGKPWYATMRRLLSLGVGRLYECGFCDNLTTIAARNIRGNYTIEHLRQDERCERIALDT